METNRPLTIGYMPFLIKDGSRPRLSHLMPKSLWRKLRELTLDLCNSRCQICQVDGVKLSLHECWEFQWVPEIEFDSDGWRRYAVDKGWVAYETDNHVYCVNGKERRGLCLHSGEMAHRDAQIASGFTPYVSEHGRLRYADEENLKPYQVLVGFLMLCGHCHSIQNLDKIWRLADAGKLDIEPILEHYMRVNGVNRNTALSEWADVRQEVNSLTVSWDGFIEWVAKVQEYDDQGNRVGFMAFFDWIERVKVEGLETISPCLFRRPGT